MNTLTIVPQSRARDLLARQTPEIIRALPSFLTADRFVRVALTTLNKTPKLLQCGEASLMACLMDCAQLGLEPDSVQGKAYLVPYGTTCTLIIGYRGLIDLAYRSGKVKSIIAQVVYEKDEFEFEFGLSSKLSHKPYLGTEPRGPVVAAYAYALLDGGVTGFDVMSADEIKAIQKRSKSGQSGPWVTDWNEMARKTVLKRLAKYLPLSTEFNDAVSIANRHEFDQGERMKAARVTLSPQIGTSLAPVPSDDEIPIDETEEETK